MMPLPPRYLMPVPLPTPFRPGDPRRLDPLGLHVRDTTDPHKVRDRLVDIEVLRRNGDGTYSPYLPMKADLVNGKVPASQLPEDQQGVTDVLVDNVSVVTGGVASIDLTGKVDKEQGKGLSSNDYTTEEKAKLSGVEAGAQKNVGEEYTSAEKAKLSGIETGAQKNVAPVSPSTDASAAGKPADAKAAGEQLAGKMSASATGRDIQIGAVSEAPNWSITWALASIESIIGNKYTKPADGIPATDLAASVQTSLGKADTALQSAPVQSVNGQTGAVVLTASDVGAAPAAAIHYAIGAARTVSGQLADRACNRVIALADNVADIVLTFPGVPQEGGGLLLAARDFLVLVTNTTGNTGSIIFSPPSGAVVYGDGFTNSPASGETWLYSATEVALNTFWVKSAKMEVAQ